MSYDYANGEINFGINLNAEPGTSINDFRKPKPISETDLIVELTSNELLPDIPTPSNSEDTVKKISKSNKKLSRSDKKFPVWAWVTIEIIGTILFVIFFVMSILYCLKRQKEDTEGKKIVES